MLSCYRSRRRLGAFLDGELAEPQARSVSGHLTACPRCQTQADELRRVRTLLRTTFQSSSPREPDWTGFWPGVVRGIDRARLSPAPAIRSVARPRRWAPRFAWGGVVAAALVGSLTAWEAMRPAQVATPGIIVSAANTDVSGGAVMVYSPPEHDLAVVWVFERD